MSAAVEVPRSFEAMLFSSFLKHAPIGLALCQSPGKILMANAAFHQLLGTASDQDSCSLSELIQPEGDLEGGKLLSELFAGKLESFHVECPSPAVDGKSVRWTMWALEGANRDTDCAIVIVEDLSAVTVARERLHQAERLEAIGRLAGGVAHDFNNVLTGVLLYCDLLLSVVGPADRARKYAEEIRTAALQASSLVRQLLSVIRSRKSLPRPICLNEVAEGMRNLLARLIGDHIELKLRLDPTLGLVKMDPAQAQQILLNLVLNGRDALPKGGEISVETGNCKMQILSDHAVSNSEHPCLPCAVFAVEDNGVGMDESVRAHIFEPFFTTKASKGSGIGLATVHDIVTSNGGLIHVQSELGRGTRISILLPLVSTLTSDSLPDPNFHPTPNGELHSFQFEETTP